MIWTSTCPTIDFRLSFSNLLDTKKVVRLMTFSKYNEESKYVYFNHKYYGWGSPLKCAVQLGGPIRGYRDTGYFGRKL